MIEFSKDTQTLEDTQPNEHVPVLIIRQEGCSTFIIIGTEKEAIEQLEALEILSFSLEEADTLVDIGEEALVVSIYVSWMDKQKLANLKEFEGC